VPKVLRAIAQTAEMAYNANDEGLWVNLYGDNTVRIVLSEAGTVECVQTSDYPWDGKIRLEFQSVEKSASFGLFVRIPEWENETVSISVNGDVVLNGKMRGAYHRIHRQWRSGDVVELDLPMSIQIMAAHTNVEDDRGKVAVRRGPVVYCLEGEDIPADMALEHIFIPGGVELEPVYTSELGGIVKLKGSLVHSTTAMVSADKLLYDPAETALYKNARFANSGKSLAGDDRRVMVSMIPYAVRLNRKNDYFRVWLPVY
jgi:DUF1680 family protein